MFIGVDYARVSLNHMVIFIYNTSLYEEDTIPLLNTQVHSLKIYW